MVENFKGKRAVHTDMRLRQQGRARTDFTKREREGRTENIHITYTQWGGRAANTVNNNILHSCQLAGSQEEEELGGLQGFSGDSGGCCLGGVSQVSGVFGLRGPSHGHPIHLLPGPGQRLGLWGSTGPQTGPVTLEGLNGSKVKGRW